MAERDIVLELIEQRKGDALRAEAAELDKLADKAEVANRSMGQLGGQSTELTRRIEEQTTKVKALAAEIERTGGDKSLFRQFSQANRELGQLNKVSDTLKKLIPEAADIGAKTGSSFMGGITQSMSAGLPPQAKTALVAAIVAGAVTAAPAIGAIVAGAVTGAVGIGGIVGGVAAAAQDPAVQGAAQDLVAVLTSEFRNAGTLFVAPTLTAIDILEDAVRDIDMRGLLAPLADAVPVLARGFGDMMRSMEPGLGRAFEAAAPAIQQMSLYLPRVGAAFGDMLGDIAESDGAIEGLVATLDILARTMQVVGTTVGWLSDRFDDVLDVAIPVGETVRDVTQMMSLSVPGMDGFNKLVADMVGHWQGWKTAGDGAVVTAGNLTGAMSNAELAARELADAQLVAENSLRQFQAAQMDALNTTLAARRGVLDLKDAVKEHGASLSNNTRAGLDNQAMILGLVDKYAAERDAAIKKTGATAEANNKYMDQINRLQELAGKLGMNKDKVYDLIAAYKSVPRGPFTTTFIQKYVTQGTPGEHSGGRIADARGKATGGPVMRGVPYVVGENRPELFIPDQHGTIQPYVPKNVGGHMSVGGGAPRLAAITVSGSALMQRFLVELQDEIRTQYGGDVVAALAPRRG